MRSARPRLAFAVLGLLLASAGAAAVPASPASAAAPTAGACTKADDVTVVVDFTTLGGGVQVRCAAWPVLSGFDALEKAGFTYEGTHSYPGLLCRINGKPANDPCFNAPPPKSYWGYWHASRGGSWTYATSGAGSYRPAKGSVEGWAFGDSPKPGIAPPAPVPTTTTRPAAPTSTTRGSGGDGTTTTTQATDSQVAGEPTTSSTVAAADGSTTTVSEGSSSTAGDRSTASGSDEQTAAMGVDGDDGGGSPVGAFVAGVAVIGLGGGAWWRNRRVRGAAGG